MTPKSERYPVSRIEVNRLKAKLVDQLDDLPANVCLAAMMELSLTFLFAVVPLDDQRKFWAGAYEANSAELPENLPTKAIH